LNLIAL